MARPVNWPKRYAALLTRYTRLERRYHALKAKKEPEPLTPRWRRMMARFIG